MPGHHTSREAITLANFMATLLAPFLTGIMLDLFHDRGTMPLLSGAYASVGALCLMPVTMFFVFLAMRICGRLACACDPWAFPVLVTGTGLIGVGVAVIQFEALPWSDRPGSRLFLCAFLAAGALTGAAYAGLISFWDWSLKDLSNSKTAALSDGRSLDRMRLA